jgi:hypothetical protein
MNTMPYFLLIIMMFSLSYIHTDAPHNEWSLVNETALVIYGPERKWEVSLLELQRPGLDGKQRTQEEITVEELLFQEAIKHQLPLDDLVDKYFASIRRQNNLSSEAFDNLFLSAGRTPQEGKDELKRTQASGIVLQEKVLGRVFIPRREVDAYDNQNPLYKEAKYYISTLAIGYESIPFAVMKQFFPEITTEKAWKQMCGSRTKWNAWVKNTAAMEALREYVLNNKSSSWQAPVKRKKSEAIDCILALSPGEISQFQVTDKGIECYRLDKIQPERRVPVEERYREIVDRLRKPKFEEMLTTYQKELLDNAAVVVLSQAVQSEQSEYATLG